jgi:hypothetical protein
MKRKMRTFSIPLSLFTLCVFLLAFQCEDEDKIPTQKEEQTELNNLKSEIELLINTPVCNESSECKYIAFVSKPYGGPWEYLIYSTSIDEQKLQDLVEDYNKKQADFNTKWGVFSDCAFVTPPTNITCENNSCIPVY